ncbi:hypothetical protein Tco_0686557 [Tanacetum coccineum]
MTNCRWSAPFLQHHKLGAVFGRQCSSDSMVAADAPPSKCTSSGGSGDQRNTHLSIVKFTLAGMVLLISSEKFATATRKSDVLLAHASLRLFVFVSRYLLRRLDFPVSRFLRPRLSECLLRNKLTLLRDACADLSSESELEDFHIEERLSPSLAVDNPQLPPAIIGR